jgi:DNA-binding beta-propeller fold protein YncE
MDKQRTQKGRNRSAAAGLAVLAALVLGMGLARHARAQIISAVIDLGDKGGGIAVNASTDRVYVCAGDQLKVYDAVTYAFVKTIALPEYSPCYDVAVNPGTNRVYVVGYRTYVINGNTNTILATLDRSGQEVAVNSSTNRVYVASMLTDPDVVQVLDGANNSWLPDIIPSSAGTNGFSHLAVNPVTNRIYIAYQGDNDLRLLDGSTHAELARFHLEYMYTVAANPSTDRVYVGNSSGDVSVLDGTSLSQIGVIGKLGMELHLNPLTNRLYGVASTSPGYVLRIADLDTDNVVGYVHMDGNLEDYDIHPGLGKLFGTNYYSPSSWSKKMTVIQDDTPTNPAPLPPPPRRIATLDLPAAGNGLDVNPLTDRLYVAVDGGGVSVFDAVTLDLLTTISLPGELYAGDIGVDETRNLVFATTGNTTHVIDAADNQVIGNLGNLGGGSGIAVNPVNGRIYIADPGTYRGESDVVKIFDGVTFAQLRRIPLGTSIYYQSVDVAVNPATGYAYATYSLDNDLRIISPETDDLLQTLDYTSFTSNVIVNPGTNRLYVRSSSSEKLGILILDGSTHAELGMIPGTITPIGMNPQANRLYGRTGSTMVQAYDGDSGEFLNRVFVDANLIDCAVHPELARLYLTQFASTVERGKKVTVIQDLGWIRERIFLPLVVR